MIDDEQTRIEKEKLSKNIREREQHIRDIAEEKVRREIEMQKPVQTSNLVLNLPKTTDLKVMAASAIPAILERALQMAYQSDNLPQILGVLKEITDRVYGKPEQSVSAKIEVSKGPGITMEEAAARIDMAIEAAKLKRNTINSSVIDVI